jgi:predicted Zn-dependent peptidase
LSRLYRVYPLLLLACLSAPAQDFQDLQKKISEFTLSNGMRFVVAERHEAPSIAARVYIRAGSINDPPGGSGLAHLFERLALGGAESVGARDAAGEKKALDAAEETLGRIEAERSKGSRADEVRIGALKLELGRAVAQANVLGNPAAYAEAMAEAGVESSVRAGADSTVLEATIPSNRAEFWFLMQAQTIQHPALRRFYDERDEAASQWRGRVENAPLAYMMAMLPAAAFFAHPYRNPVAGWPSDLAALRLTDARQFVERYWAPGNITVALAGDLTPEEARRLAERYFGAIPARPLPPAIHTVEPDQKGPRMLKLENSSQAMLAVGYKRPDEFDREDVVLEVIRGILTGGRGGWLARELVETRHLASNVQVQSSYPGGRYPHLFAIVAGVTTGHTPEEAENAITAVIAKLQNAPVDDDTLERGRSVFRAGVVSRLTDNAGIATMLASSAGEYGDWRQIFEVIANVDKVTAAQVQVAALKYLTPSRRTSVYVTTPPPIAKPARGAAE